MKIILPFPPAALSPNARLFWGTIAKKKKLYRYQCYIEARLQIGVMTPAIILADDEKLSLHLIFYPPDKRKRDWDNMLAASKSGLDGLADAIGIDDSKWRISFNVAEPFKGGKVEVTIE